MLAAWCPRWPAMSEQRHQLFVELFVRNQNRVYRGNVARATASTHDRRAGFGVRIPSCS